MTPLEQLLARANEYKENYYWEDKNSAEMIAAFECLFEIVKVQAKALEYYECDPFMGRRAADAIARVNEIAEKGCGE